MCGFLTSLAQTFESGGIWYYRSSSASSKVEVTYNPNIQLIYLENGIPSFSNNSYSGDVKIPETVTYNGEKLTVTGVRTYAFAGSKNLKSVYLPKTIQMIEQYLFNDCPNLKSVAIDPDNDLFITKNDALLSKDGKQFYMLFPYISGRYVVPEGVTGIGNYPFAFTNITSVVLPKTLSSWIYNTFILAFNLQNIEVATGNDNFYSNNGFLYTGDRLLACPNGKQGRITVPENIKTIGDAAFYWCEKITHIDLPAGLESIGENAFCFCKSLSELTIPDNATYSGRSLFYDSGIKTLNIPSKNVDVNAIRSASLLENVTVRPVGGETNYYSQDGALFRADGKQLVLFPCGRAGSYVLPEDIKGVGEYAFANCKNLTSITIHKDVNYFGQYAFSGCKLNPLYIKSNNRSFLSNNVFTGLEKGSVVLLDNDGENESLSSIYPGITFASAKCPSYITDLNTYLKGATFRLEKNQYYQGEDVPVTVYIDRRGVGEYLVTPGANGLYRVMNLEPDTKHTLYAVYGTEYNQWSQVQFKTTVLTLNCVANSTQTTATFSNISATSDDYCKLTGIGIIFDGKEYAYSDKPITIKGLSPNKTYSYRIYADYGTERVYKDGNISTKGASPGINRSDLGPTSVVLSASYNAGDAKVARVYFTMYNDKAVLQEGTKYIVTGLIPNTEYNFSFKVEFEDGTVQTTSTGKFKTPALKLVTLQPKGVSSTCSIVAAETNISDYETGAGFQWKKYDAPASLAPSEGYAAIYEGMLEGYIRNLQPTSYYNVRAFYKSASGTYYYGDWITFDPSDFSYFEPTVHTYAVSDISHNSAQVRGYVIAGTDDIQEQGFQYWPVNNTSRVKSVMAAPEQDVMTVLSKGQVMIATLTDLEPATTYICRAFVKTVAGITYGEEQTFSTESDPSGIGSVTVDGSDIVIVGYYDINGRRYDVPQRGLNIVVYSNGKAEKLIVK